MKKLSLGKGFKVSELTNIQCARNKFVGFKGSSSLPKFNEKTTRKYANFSTPFKSISKPNNFFKLSHHSCVANYCFYFQKFYSTSKNTLPDPNEFVYLNNLIKKKGEKESYNNLYQEYENRLKFYECLVISQKAYDEIEKRLDKLLQKQSTLSQEDFEEDQRQILSEKANICNNLANVYKIEGNYNLAMKFYTDCLEISKSIYSGRRHVHSDLIIAYNNIGSFLTSLGSMKDAEKYLTTALALNEKEHGKLHHSNAPILNNLSSLYKMLGNFQHAERLLKSAHSILLKHYNGENHLEISYSCNNMGTLYLITGNFYKAEKMFLKVIEIRQNIYIAEKNSNDDPLSPENFKGMKQKPITSSEIIDLSTESLNHPDIATALNNLAECFKHSEKYDLAEKYFKKALQVLLTFYGDNHIDVAYAYYNLAGLYLTLGRSAESEENFNQSLKIMETTLGPNHPRVTIALNNLAEFYKSSNQLDKAENLWKNSLKLNEENLSPDHPDLSSSLNFLGSFYLSENRMDEAEPLLLRSLSILENNLKKHNKMINSNNNNTENNSIIIDETIENKESVGQICSEEDNETEMQMDPDSIAILDNLGDLYYRKKDYQKAIKYFSRLILILENQVKVDHFALHSALGKILDVVRAQSSENDLLKSFNDDLISYFELKRKNLEEKHPHTLGPDKLDLSQFEVVMKKNDNEPDKNNKE